MRSAIPKSSILTKKIESSDDHNGKSIVLVTSKEEDKRAKEEEILQGRMLASLVRQGGTDLDGLDHLNKVWFEETIRNMGFGEVQIFERTPKESFNIEPEKEDQLDIPRTPILFKAKCFQL